MTPKRIALVNYAPEYFQNFGAALEEAGFIPFWIYGTRSAARYQSDTLHTSAARVLDSTAGFRFDPADVERCRGELAGLECEGGPRIHDIIMMDRMLRLKPHAFALCYLAHLQRVLTAFLTDNAIGLVTSGRDSALQLVSMLVCRKIGIAWVVPTRARIPQDMYAFASSHDTAALVPIRDVTDDDRKWAEEFLRVFSDGRSKPALKAAARSFSDVFRMMPRHLRLLTGLFKASVVDRGNDFSRYTLGQIVRMYLVRRINMALFKAFPPYVSVGRQPFCLYALHTQPESSIDVAGSFFSDQIALITFVARSLPVSHELYVKIHPTDVDGKPLAFYRAIARIPGVRLINYDVDSRALIRAASIVFILTGTIGYEAALSGRTVVAFAKNFFNDMPGVHYCESPPRLPKLVDSLLASSGPEPDARARSVAFLAHLRAQSFPGEVNREYLPSGERLNQDDLRTLQQAYAVLYAGVNGRD